MVELRQGRARFSRVSEFIAPYQRHQRHLQTSPAGTVENLYPKGFGYFYFLASTNLDEETFSFDDDRNDDRKYEHLKGVCGLLFLRRR